MLNETLCPFVESARLKFSRIVFVDDDCVVVVVVAVVDKRFRRSDELLLSVLIRDNGGDDNVLARCLTSVFVSLRFVEH